MNNYCSNCGNKLKEGEVKCKKCSIKISVDETKEKKGCQRTFKIFGYILLIIIIIIIIYIIINLFKDAYKKSHFEEIVQKEIEIKYNKKFESFKKIETGLCYTCLKGLNGSCDGTDFSFCKDQGEKCKSYKYEARFNDDENIYIIYVFQGKKLIYYENIEKQKEIQKILDILEKNIGLKINNIKYDFIKKYGDDEYDYKEDVLYDRSYGDGVTIYLNNSFIDVSNIDFFETITDIADQLSDDKTYIKLIFSVFDYIHIMKNEILAHELKLGKAHYTGENKNDWYSNYINASNNSNIEIVPNGEYGETITE